MPGTGRNPSLSLVTWNIRSLERIPACGGNPSIFTMRILFPERSEKSANNFNCRVLMERSHEWLKSKDFYSLWQCLDANVLLFTANLFKRLFSMARFALTNRFKSILLVNLETLQYLYMIRDLWQIHDSNNLEHNGHVGETSLKRFMLYCFAA